MSDLVPEPSTTDGLPAGPAAGLRRCGRCAAPTSPSTSPCSATASPTGGCATRAAPRCSVPTPPVPDGPGHDVARHHLVHARRRGGVPGPRQHGRAGRRRPVRLRHRQALYPHALAPAGARPLRHDGRGPPPAPCPCCSARRRPPASRRSTRLLWWRWPATSPPSATCRTTPAFAPGSAGGRVGAARRRIDLALARPGRGAGGAQPGSGRCSCGCNDLPLRWSLEQPPRPGRRAQGAHDGHQPPEPRRPLRP